MSGKYRSIPEEIRKVTPKHLPKKEEIRELERGEVNLIFIATTETGEECILRIPREERRKSHRCKFKAEAWALEQAAKKGIPVPKVLAFDESSDPSFMLETKVPGAPFATIYRHLPKRERDNFLKEIGRHLAKIHSIRTQGFGWMFEEGRGLFSSWPEFLAASIEGNISYLKEHVLLSQRDERKLKEYLSQHTNLFRIADPHLLHGDLHGGHFFYEAGKLAGIIDFEGCKSGDPLYDLAYLELNAEAGVGKTGETMIAKVYEGYGNPKMPGEKMTFYKAAIAAGRLCWAHQTGRSGIPEVKKLLQRYIEALP